MRTTTQTDAYYNDVRFCDDCGDTYEVKDRYEYRCDDCILETITLDTEEE
jgi:hypothetical protein